MFEYSGLIVLVINVQKNLFFLYVNTRVVILPKASTSRISELSTFHRNTVNLTPEPIIKQVIWSNFNLKKQI